MKIVVTSPFRAGNSWLVTMLSRILGYARGDLGVSPQSSILASPDNTIFRSNFVMSGAEGADAVVVRVLRNIPDAVAAKLLYGVSNYLGQNKPVSQAFQDYLNAVAVQPAEFREDKGQLVSFAVTNHLSLVNQFVRENVAHHVDPRPVDYLVTYEELSFAPVQWLQNFLDANNLTPVKNIRQVVANCAPGNNPSMFASGQLDITVSNWCANNLSSAVYQTLLSRVDTIYAQMKNAA